MKTLIQFSFNQGVAEYWPVRHLLEKIGCADELKGLETPFPGLYSRTFDADDPKLQELRTTLRKAGFEWNETVSRVYNDAELRAFPLLLLGGPKFGTEYDASTGCPSCGTGSLQTSPLGIPPSGPPARGQICGTYRGDFLVGKELAAALREAPVSGLELRQARSPRGSKRLPWWQIISTYTMPKMSSKTKGVLHDTRPGWGCSVCGRDCYEGMEEMVFDRGQVKLTDLPDLVQTWECFGGSIPQSDPQWATSCGPAPPLILVKAKVLDIFRKLKVKHAEFEPVRII
jgi:hypothetical protein